MLSNGSGSHDLLEGVCKRIKATNFVIVLCSNPHLPIMTDSNIPGTCTSRRNRPLLEGLKSRVIHTKSIIHGHGEPDVAISIKSEEERLSITRGELVCGRPARGARVKYSKHPRRGTCAAHGCRIAGRSDQPDLSPAVKGCAPRIISSR